jgi:hypothetical protein
MSRIGQSTVPKRGARKTPGPYIKGRANRGRDKNQLIVARQEMVE